MIKKAKKAKIGPEKVTVDDLERFFRESKNIPDDDDTGYCLDFFMHEVNGKSDPNKFNESSIEDTAVFATKRLLKNALEARILHSDGTYKLNFHNYPVLVFGTTDVQRAFHIIAFAITSHETAKAYEFCFETVKTATAATYGEEMPVECLMSDKDRATKVAFRKVFPHRMELSCWFHAQKNMEKKLAGSKNKAKVLDDIRCLQKCSDDVVFGVGSELFVKKWKNSEPQFVEYFEEHWLTAEDKNWFAGAKYFAASTNNALESTNRRIKDDFDLRHRCKMSVFKVKLMQIMRQYSVEYRDERRRFQHEIKISKSMWKIGIEWARSSKSVIGEPCSNGRLFFLPAGDRMRVVKKECTAYKRLSCGTFDAFVELFYSLRKVFIPNDIRKFKEATCSCPIFLNEYICKHVIGMGLRLQIIKIPANMAEIGGVRGRGRPKKIGPALSQT